MNIVIIGGGTAGTTVALYLRKLSKDVEITILESSKFTQFSPCSLPYHITKEVEDLFVMKDSDYKSGNINLMLDTKINSINKNKKIVSTSNGEIEYDKLVISTGSKSFVPNGLEGLTLKNPDDIRLIEQKCKKNSKVAIIGGGYIGAELAYTLNKIGCKITLFEATSQILPSLDTDMSDYVKSYLESQGILIITDAVVSQDGKEIISSDKKTKFDEIIIAAGFTPNLDLVEGLGLKINKGIIVDDYLRVDKDIFACGDCIEVKDFVTEDLRPAYFATHAVRQAEIVAENLLGAKKKFLPVLNANISDVGLYVGSVGISSRVAENKGMQIITGRSKGTTKSDHHKNAKEIIVKLIADKKGILLGGQVIGAEDVSGRINLLSLAIKNKNTIYDVAEMETCYNPASAPIFDVVTKAARMCIKRMR
ncbi:MAG: NAD(P)/FAD-dependent oxidoreductase [Nanoarchaeota archaeon]